MFKSLGRSTLVALLVMSICACGRMIAFAQGTTATQVARASEAQDTAAASAQTPTTKQGATARGASQINFAPLSADEKMKRALRSAFLSPAGYAFTALSATITEARERRQPQKTTEDRVADGLSRFAIDFGTYSTSVMFGTGIYPVIFKQDPRYRPASKKGFGARTLYAASRVFVAYTDDGRREPNYSNLGGDLTASALANIWERNTPGRRRIGVRPTFTRFGSSLGFDMLNNIVFKEFWPDIKKKFGHK
ncbi:MAG TPA: hypothetical protein VE821_13245 [Pyrinomonadaceae bacterium]|nr:hypothetical protein [Pyrinomonadaceae bacterium]